MKPTFCYLPENAPHHLDHLIPLAIELDLPVMTRSEALYDLICEFYPKARQIWIPPHEMLPLSKESVIISTLPRFQLELELFLEMQLYGSFESVFCPHGLSDKELLSSRFEELYKDQKVLLYGLKMGQEIPSSCCFFYVGNYRKHHFASHRNQYKEKLLPYLKPFSKATWKLLWAPTWMDKATGNSYLPQILRKSLLGKIPEEIEIIFKPHPHLALQIPSLLKEIKEASHTTPNLHYIENVPYIYPLLEMVDSYLGDTSSIGYDFLTTGKPFFSLSKNKDSPWQKIAMEAPLEKGALAWGKIVNLASHWDASNTKELLESAFAHTQPLCACKEAFSIFLNEASACKG